ncbi:MAG: MFS transporter [Candidatus Omnitrophota bacterium]
MFLSYFKILKRRNFFFLWFGQVVSQFGDRLTQIALIGFASNIYQSSSKLAFTLSMTIIPVLVFSPISGVYVDRWSKRKTMYISDLIRSACIFLIPLSVFKMHFPFLIYILIFLSFTVGRFFIPAKMAFVPRIISKDEIFMANSLISVTATVAAIFGVGLGGIIVESCGVKTAFVIDGFTFLVSGLAILFIRKEEKGRFVMEDIIHIGKDAVNKVKQSFLWELHEGIKYIFNSDETRYAFRAFFFLYSYIGAVSIIFMRFVQNTLGSLTKDLGFMAVALGGGIFLGSLVYGRIADKFNVKKVINAATLIASIFLMFFTVFLKAYPDSLYAVLLSFLFGLIISPLFIGVNSLIHRESDQQLLGRIFSGLEFTAHLGLLLAMFIAAFFADIFSPYRVIISICLIGLVFSLIFIYQDGKGKRV